MLRSAASSVMRGAQQAPALDEHCLQEARHRVRARFLHRWSSGQGSIKPSLAASPAQFFGLQSAQEHTENVYLDKARERLDCRFLARWPSARDPQQHPAIVMQLGGRMTKLEGIGLEKSTCLEDARQRLHHRFRARFLHHWSSGQDSIKPLLAASPASFFSGLQSAQEHTENAYLDKARERLDSRFLARWPSANDQQQRPAVVMQLGGRMTKLEGIGLEKSNCLEDARQRLHHRFARDPQQHPAAVMQLGGRTTKLAGIGVEKSSCLEEARQRLRRAVLNKFRTGRKQCVGACLDIKQAKLSMRDIMQVRSDHSLKSNMAASMNTMPYSIAL